MGTVDDMLLAWTVDLVLRQELPSDLLIPCSCASLTAYTLKSD